MKLYGTSKSRASRSLWALEELAVAYEQIPIAPYTQSRSPEYLRINPNGHIPALDDDGLIIWESMAINLYLADKHGRAPLWPGTPAERGAIYQWSFWAVTENEPRQVAHALARRSGDASASKAALEGLMSALAVLNTHLRRRSYLLGDTFTIADLNLASCLREPQEHGIGNNDEIKTSVIPAVMDWLDRCCERPSYRAVRDLP